MEIKEPVAIFNAEGFKMLIEALQEKKVDFVTFTPQENEVDSFIDEYTKYKAGETKKTDGATIRSHRTPESHYEAVFNLLRNADGPLKMPAIRSLLESDYGIIRDPKSYTQLLAGAMKRYPIEKTGYGTYGLKPEFIELDRGNENE